MLLLTDLLDLRDLGWISPRRSLHRAIQVDQYLEGRKLVFFFTFLPRAGFWYRNFQSLSTIPNVRLHAIDWLGSGQSTRVEFVKNPEQAQEVGAGKRSCDHVLGMVGFVWCWMPKWFLCKPPRFFVLTRLWVLLDHPKR